jgi:isoquinoline 1-oxidoreductase beta subunit
MKIVALNRRNFLKSSAFVVGGLLLGFEAPVNAQLKNSAVQLGPFLQITTEGRIRLGVPVVEMGQGIYTSLAMSVVEELEMTLDQVEDIQTIFHPTFKNPAISYLTSDKLRLQMTGGSTSLTSWGKHYQIIGATAREMLITVASNEWDVLPNDLKVDGKNVLNLSTGEAFSYSQLVGKAGQIIIPEKPKIKDPQEFKVIGKPIKRWDTLSKINGAAVFGADINLPEMLYGTIKHTPILGSKIIGVDDKKAKSVDGYIASIPLEEMVVVVAASTWSAMQSAAEIFIHTEGGFPALNNESIKSQLAEDAKLEGVQAGNKVGNVEDSFASSSTVVEHEYELSIQAQAAMEPLTATASVTNDQCEFWGPIQVQDLPMMVAKQVTGLPPDKIKVNTTFLGGGFGRKAEADFIVPPIVASKILGKPVQITWSREEDIRGGFYRPPSLVKLKAGLDSKGLLNSFEAKVISPSPSLHFAQDLGFFFPPWIDKNGYDWAAVEGMPQQPLDDIENQYAIPNINVKYVPSNIPIKWGFWRSIGASGNKFAVESFMDEIAQFGNIDPIELRAHLLKHNPRALRVLEETKIQSNWGNPKDGNFQGFAYSDSLNCVQTQVAEISISNRGTVRVHQITCILDCGPIHNPHIVRQQVEGSIIFGLTAALMDQINVNHGQIVESNYDDYKMIKLKQTPPINVQLVSSKAKQGRIGEIGTPLIGPAVTNAVFAATGKRIRHLPIRKEDLA